MAISSIKYKQNCCFVLRPTKGYKPLTRGQHINKNTKYWSMQTTIQTVS